MTFDAARTLRVWGAFDAFHVLWYCLLSLKAGRPPFWDDARATLAAAPAWGGPMYYVVLSWALELSLLASAVLLLLAWRPARYLALAQIPVRLIALVPSVSLLIPVAGYLPPMALLTLIFLSEGLKGWSLWRCGRCDRRLQSPLQ